MRESKIVRKNGAPSQRVFLRQQKILDGALAAISRYGFERCTIHDIASESGTTRQTLYKYYQSKDEVLRALVSRINDEANRDALNESMSDKPFRHRLYAVLDARLGRIQRILAQGGHGAEISDATHRVGGQLTIEADKAYLELVRKMFGQAEQNGEIRIRKTGPSVEKYADLSVFAAKGLMREAGDVDYRSDYGAALDDLCDVICASLER